MSIFKEDECFNQLETKIPNFHNKILQLILEDIQSFMEPTSTQQGGISPIIFYYLLSNFYKDWNFVVSDDPSTTIDGHETILLPERFLRLLRSDEEVWPAIMRLLLFLIGFVRLKGLRFLEENMSIANVTANRSIAEFVLSSPDRRNNTAEALKLMVGYASFFMHVDLREHSGLELNFEGSDELKELELAILNVLTCFTGHLDHWETQFRKHGLPGGGPSEHYFASLVGVTDFSHVEARITRLIISRNAPSDLLH